MIVTEGFYGVLERWGCLFIGTRCLLKDCGTLYDLTCCLSFWFKKEIILLIQLPPQS